MGLIFSAFATVGALYSVYSVQKGANEIQRELPGLSTMDLLKGDATSLCQKAILDKNLKIGHMIARLIEGTQNRAEAISYIKKLKDEGFLDLKSKAEADGSP